MTRSKETKPRKYEEVVDIFAVRIVGSYYCGSLDPVHEVQNDYNIIAFIYGVKREKVQQDTVARYKEILEENYKRDLERKNNG